VRRSGQKRQAPFELLARRYDTPRRVQKLLRLLDYNREEEGISIRSALEAWKTGRAHCLEAAFLAAAILEHRGYPPLVVSIESQDKLDHVIFAFRARTGWGAVARSRDEGLHGRAPCFRSVRDLVRSYVEPFVDKTGRITGFALALLDDSGARWRDSPRNVWKVEKFLIDHPHETLRTSEHEYRLFLARYLSGRPHPRKKYWW
jgi:hypothetical protein